MSSIDRMRAKQHQHGFAAKMENDGQKEVAAFVEAIPKPKKAKKDPGPLVTFRCGHSKPVAAFSGKDCGGCVDKKRQAENEARKERNKAKWKAMVMPARLPDGSQFTKVYDAKTETWTGLLMVPGAATFNGTASAESKLEHLLDRQYREWMAANTNKE